MSTKIFDVQRNNTLSVLTDAAGATYLLKPNGKKHYYLDVAITSGVTLDDADTTAPVAGDTAETSHATGLNSIFTSNGTEWEFLTNA